jgi:hypothetical protein
MTAACCRPFWRIPALSRPDPHHPKTRDQRKTDNDLGAVRHGDAFYKLLAGVSPARPPSR